MEAIHLNIRDLQSGDRLIFKIAHLGITHHAIFLIDKYGQGWVAENRKIVGIRFVKIEQYTWTGSPEIIVKKFIGGEAARQQAFERAINIHGNYDLFFFNCEHYANYIQFGSLQSKQVEIVGLLALAGLFVASVQK